VCRAALQQLALSDFASCLAGPQQAFAWSQHAAPSWQHFCAASQQARFSSQHFIPFAQQPSLESAEQQPLAGLQQAIFAEQQSFAGSLEVGVCAFSGATAIAATIPPKIMDNPKIDFVNIVIVLLN
jgi:hypothetical protein